MFYRLVCCAFTSLFVTLAPLHSGAATAVSPKEEVGTTIEALVTVVQKFSLDNQMKERRSHLREIINPRFDFDEMAKRSLGAFWNEVTPEQQAEFVSLFSNLLAKTYLNRIETIKPGMVKIEGEELQEGGEDGIQKALVKTTVTNKGDVFPINYRLLNREGKWRVYDVIIENIGLVANYRSEFAGIIRKEKMDGLLKRLREKQQV